MNEVFRETEFITDGEDFADGQVAERREITGGIAKFVLPMCKKKIIYDKDLLVKGLATLYRENKRP